MTNILENDDSDKEDLLSNNTDNSSDTSYCDESGDLNYVQSVNAVWKYIASRYEGRVLILGEWISRTKSHRHIVIGPDWPCVIMTYVVICVPSIFVFLYLLHNTIEMVIFFIVLTLTIFGLTAVFLADPGLVRRYHHARTRQWTFCDHCESFRPPGSVHCSTCQVCVAGYDHHCPWTGKCVGVGNVIYFKIFVISLSWLVVLCLVLLILNSVSN